jgi:hypothetical protein
MAYGIILKHLEVDNILKKKEKKNLKKEEGWHPLRGAPTAFSAGKEGWVPFF